MKNNILDNQNLKKNPFAVPEGYFDSLQNDIMSRISQEQTPKVVAMKPAHRWIRPLITVAASACIGIVGVTAYMHNAGIGLFRSNEMASFENSDSYSWSDDADDYVMFDNEAIYSYLSEH